LLSSPHEIEAELAGHFFGLEREVLAALNGLDIPDKGAAATAEAPVRFRVTNRSLPSQVLLDRHFVSPLI